MAITNSGMAIADKYTVVDKKEYSFLSNANDYENTSCIY